MEVKTSPYITLDFKNVINEIHMSHICQKNE
jgi:hypothetical protein